jgi:hypothetical protein
MKKELTIEEIELKKQYQKAWREINSEKLKKYEKNRREKNKEKIKERQKKYREENKEKISKYREENKEKIKEKRREYNQKEEIKIKRKEYLKNNKEKIKVNKKKNIEVKKYEYKKVRNERHKYRLLTEPLYKLKTNTRTLINLSFKRNGYKKKSKSEIILGCSFEDFKTYLESKFESWMNWDNRGLYNGTESYGWDIDHIEPLTNAKTEEDIIRLNHYTNLQPLCSKVNRDIKKDVYNLQLGSIPSKT